MLAGRDLTHGPLRFVYQLLLVDRTWDAVRLLGRALWPEDDWLAARYGRRDAPTRCRHLLGALRGQGMSLSAPAGRPPAPDRATARGVGEVCWLRWARMPA